MSNKIVWELCQYPEDYTDEYINLSKYYMKVDDTYFRLPTFMVEDMLKMQEAIKEAKSLISKQAKLLEEAHEMVTGREEVYNRALEILEKEKNSE